MRIALLGDIAPIGRYCRVGGSIDKNYFYDVATALSAYDLVIGNLEAPLTDSRDAFKAKSANLKAAPDNVSLLKELGVSHVTLANNHIGDFGLEGLEDTIRILDKNKISWFGVDGKACRIRQGSNKVALCGFCSFDTNPSRVFRKKEQRLNVLDVDAVLKTMEENHAEGYLNILAIHSGQEHLHMPSSSDVSFARGLARKFDYIYYGHHPHTIQGVEEVNNSLLCYSLGNFIFDDVYTHKDRNNPLIKLTEANKTGIIISLEIEDNLITKYEVIPTYLGKDKMKIGNDSVSVPLEEYDSALISACSPNYDNRRTRIITEYIESRKSLRNLGWYLKRLNLNSFRLILAARKNSQLYHQSFLDKLSNFENEND